MRKAGALYDRLVEWNPAVASYIVPNGYNRRVLFTMNLREVFHFCRIRGASNAHFSIQRVAFQLAESVQQVYPLLGAYLDIDPKLTWGTIEGRYFSDVSVQ
jgi:thymidylate synthase ThyX